MPTPDVELLRRVLEKLDFSHAWEWDLTRIARRDPEDRDGWRSCAYGVEGHAIELSHPNPLWHWQPDPEWGGTEFAVLVTVDGSRKKPGRNAAFVARKLLGLDQAQADRLFGADTIEDVRRIVAELCDGASS